MTELRVERKATRRSGGRQTIKDVAQRAGVSAMTVSRVINGEQNVSAETRIRVNQAVQELGYAPNLAARSLASAQALRIGLLYSNPSAAYLSEFLLGSLEQCSAAAIQLMVEKCDAESGEEIAVRRLIATGVDGVILPPPLCDSHVIVEMLEAAGIPTVVVATGEPPRSASAIRIDDFRAAEAMTRHLIDLGHQRIGFIKGHPNQTVSALRYAGYLSAMSAAGLNVDLDYVTQGYFTYHSGLDATDRLLALPKRPTAIFASNDDMAAAAIAVAHRQGLDVPGDVTVCGFDDTALATTVWPPMTTIRQPVAAMSREAVLLVISAIRRKTAGKPTKAVCEVMDFTLVRRQSDGHPPAQTSRRRKSLPWGAREKTAPTA
jgi:LacI family transcriptional regulator